MVLMLIVTNKMDKMMESLERIMEHRLKLLCFISSLQNFINLI